MLRFRNGPEREQKPHPNEPERALVGTS
jgi:hypothetical protein